MTLKPVPDKPLLKIRSRCHDLTAELSKVTNRQVMVVNDESNKQLTKFRNEARELERLNQQMHDFEQNASKLLEKPTSTNFINQSRMLLSYKFNEGSYRQGYTQNTWRRPVFKAPATQAPISSEDFLNFMEDHVLGHIDVDIAGDEEEAEKDGGMDLKSDSEPELSSPSLQHQQSYNQSQTSLATTSQYSSSAFSTSMDTDITNILDKKSVASRKSTYVEDALSSEHTVDEVNGAAGVQPKPKLSKTGGKRVLKLDFHLKGSPKGTHLRKFHNITFSDHSMWLCGWTRYKGRSNDIVLVQLQGPNYDVRCKEKKSDKEAGLPNFVQFYGGYLLFAKKGSKEIYSLSTDKSGTAKHGPSYVIRGRYQCADHSIGAICCSNDQVYIVDQRNLEYIRVLNSRYYYIGTTFMLSFQD